MPKEYRTYGDKLTPLGFALKQRSCGDLVAVNLTGRVVKVQVVDLDGVTVVAETTTGVSVVDAEAGTVSYALPTGESRLEPGEYYVYFRAYGTGGDAAKADVYPTSLPESNRMHLVIGGLA